MKPCLDQQLQAIGMGRTRSPYLGINSKGSDDKGKVREREERKEDIPSRSKSKVPFEPPAPASPALRRISLSVRLASSGAAWASLSRTWSSKARRGLRGVTGSSTVQGSVDLMAAQARQHLWRRTHHSCQPPRPHQSSSYLRRFQT